MNVFAIFGLCILCAILGFISHTILSINIMDDYEDKIRTLNASISDKDEVIKFYKKYYGDCENNNKNDGGNK